MKIVICIWNFFGGGAERVAVLLANALVEQGCTVWLYCANEDGPNRDLVSPHVEVLVARGPGALAYFAGLARIIRSHEPDVVQSHQTTRNVLAIVAHCLSPQRKRRIVVCVEHGEMKHTAKHVESRSLRFFFLAARFLYPVATVVIAVSGNVQQSVKAYIAPFRARCVVMDNPVVTSAVATLSLQPPTHPWMSDAGKTIIVGIGRLESQKGFDLLINSFALVTQSLDAYLIIFGEGSLRRSLENLVTALHLSERVSLPGYTNDVYSVLSRSNLFVLSSVWEGLPTVAIEALACGTRVVSTDNSAGIRSILAEPESGDIVTAATPLSLSQSILKSLAKPYDKAKLLASVSRYGDKYIAARHLELYNDLRHKGSAVMSV